ncbi:MAG: hypothetical protein OEU92_16335 [Alphaproteobacteria bacterium]|nr:hypothetical protein [Alphaproteobacteria bacterium]
MMRRLPLHMIGFGLIAFLTGCLGQQGPEPQVVSHVSLPAAGLPHYQPGTRYQFDNGRLETVAHTAGEKVTWTFGRKGSTKEVRYRNPAMPPLERTSKSSTTESTIAAPPDSLWPLQPGNTVHFTEKQLQVKSDGTRKSRRRAWSCSVDKAVRIHTKAGIYDSFPIECSRQSNSAKMRWYETKRWFYAPSVGHYVRFEHERRRKPTKVYELVAIGDLDGMHAAIDPELAAVIQPALERNRSNQPLTEMVKSGYQVTVTPTETWRNRTGRYCRDYVIETEGSRVEGSACRQTDGVWRPNR